RHRPCDAHREQRRGRAPRDHFRPQRGGPGHGVRDPDPNAAGCDGVLRISDRAASFQESVIREMTRLHAIHGGVNLAQGYPDFDPPAEIIEAACRALHEGFNQYAITWGAPRLRQAIARRAAEFNRIPTDPDRNVTV